MSPQVMGEFQGKSVVFFFHKSQEELKKVSSIFKRFFFLAA